MAKRATTNKINAVTKRLLGHYRGEAERKAKKEKERKAFFELLTELVETSSTLAQKTVEVPGFFWDDPDAYIKDYYPEWRLLAIDDEHVITHEGPVLAGVQALIEERPDFKAATWVNAALGMVFAKQVRQGSPTLDDDRLMEEDPWLYNDLLERVWQIKPLDELDAEALGRLQPYIYLGKPTVALQKPRKATPEEMGTINVSD